MSPEIDVDRCNSIFELFTAFNFTYTVLSAQDSTSEQQDNNSFVDVIDNKLLRVFSTLIRQCDSVISGANLLNESIDARIEQLPPTLITPRDTLSRLKGKIEGLLQRCDLRRKELESLKEENRKKINESLPYTCFLMAFFCIECIGVSISQAPFKHGSLLLIVTSFLIIRIIKYFFPITSFYTLSKFIIAFTIFITIFHFISLYSFQHYSKEFQDLICSVDTHNLFKTVVILLALILPLYHFVYYFFSFSSTLLTLQEERVLLISGFEQELKDISQEFSQIQ